MTDIERHRASPAKESFTSPRRNSHSGHKKKQSGEMQFLPGGSKRDPLNLEGLERKRQRQTTPNPEGSDTEMPSPSKRDSSSQGGNNKRRRKDSNNSAKRLMSPSAKQHRHHSPSVDAKKATNEREPTEKEKAIDNAAELRKKKKEYFNNKYRYGNFDRYYGHRLSQGETDPRMTLMSKDWFEKRTVLDIGCNVGFLTLSIARDYNPRRILGIDIDEHLIGVARKNIRHYCDKDTQLVGKFPASFAAQFGTISKQPVPTFSTKFPDNIWFRKENYVLECDEMLDMVEPEFDTILALSITKWIHLNYGDDGMRRFFRRAFEQLQPGGRLIVEPQPFSSYKKRAFMTEHLKMTYATIQFKPEDFESYLVDIVGFERVEHLGIPPAMSKGFERPLEVYVKSQKPIKAKKAKEGAKSTEPDSSSAESNAPSADATPSGSSEPIQE